MNDPDRTVSINLTERELAQIAIALALYGVTLGGASQGLRVELADAFADAGHARAEMLDVRDLVHKIERVMHAPAPPPGRA